MEISSPAMTQSLPLDPTSSSPPTPSSHICYICRRRLPSAEMLSKHEQFSALHERNLKLQKQTFQRRRSDLRDDVVRIRANHSPSSDLSKAERDLAQVQEEIEARAHTEVKLREEKNFKNTDDIKLIFEGSSWRSNKPTNEDRMCVGFELLGGTVTGCFIADGHSGPDCADYLVERFVATLEMECRRALLGTTGGIKGCTTECPPEDPSATISEALLDIPSSSLSSLLSASLQTAFSTTDQQYLERAAEGQISSGSTLIVALFFPSRGDTTGSPSPTKDPPVQCILAHVGDCRAVLSGGQTVLALTSDHKPDRPDEQARLLACGGRVADISGVWRVFTPNVVSVGGRTLQWGLAVSRAMGDLPLKRPVEIVSAVPEISGPIVVDRGSFMVIGCDGIFDVLSDVDCVQAASEGGSASVVRAAYGKLSDDNLTAIVVRIGGADTLATGPGSTLSRPSCLHSIENSSPSCKRTKTNF